MRGAKSLHEKENAAMAALAKRRYTLEEYLEIEKHAEERYATVMAKSWP